MAAAAAAAYVAPVAVAPNTTANDETVRAAVFLSMSVGIEDIVKEEPPPHRFALPVGVCNVPLGLRQVESDQVAERLLAGSSIASHAKYSPFPLRTALVHIPTTLLVNRRVGVIEQCEMITDVQQSTALQALEQASEIAQQMTGDLVPILIELGVRSGVDGAAEGLSGYTAARFFEAFVDGMGAVDVLLQDAARDVTRVQSAGSNLCRLGALQTCQYFSVDELVPSPAELPPVEEFVPAHLVPRIATPVADFMAGLRDRTVLFADDEELIQQHTAALRAAEHEITFRKILAYELLAVMIDLPLNDVIQYGHRCGPSGPQDGYQAWRRYGVWPNGSTGVMFAVWNDDESEYRPGEFVSWAGLPDDTTILDLFRDSYVVPDRSVRPRLIEEDSNPFSLLPYVPTITWKTTVSELREEYPRQAWLWIAIHPLSTTQTEDDDTQVITGDGHVSSVVSQFAQPPAPLRNMACSPFLPPEQDLGLGVTNAQIAAQVAEMHAILTKKR